MHHTCGTTCAGVSVGCAEVGRDITQPSSRLPEPCPFFFLSLLDVAYWQLLCELQKHLLVFFFFLKERQSFCFPILVIVKIHCYFLFYFSGIVLTLFARGYVMHGMIIWLFKRSGIHITGENIAGPTYIIAHTKDL